MIHVFSQFQPKDPEARRRYQMAQASWRCQQWVEKPIDEAKSPRLFLDGDRRIPYVPDIFTEACQGQPDNQIIVFTNSDIICRSDCAMQIAAQMQDTHALYGRRRDFGHRLKEIPADNDFVSGVPYAGADLFAFRVYWWITYKSYYPEMLLAHEAWDACMVELITMTCPPKACEIRNVICHERHASRWENPANRHKLPGQIHNLRAAFEWLTNYGINPAQHGIQNV